MNIELIRLVIKTLNNIEVKGKSNMDKLLGCINALESMVEPKEEVNNDG